MPTPGPSTATSSPISLSIVIVSWQCGPELLRCVGSLAENLPAAPATEVELVVIDNASTDLDEDALFRLWPAVSLLRNPRNRGFGPAANQGVRSSSAELVLLLNPDTVATAGALDEVIRSFAERPDAVAIAPRLVDAPGRDGEPQERFQLRRFPTWGQLFRELLLLDKAFPDSAALRHERYLDVDRTAAFTVEQPAAAALAFRKTAFLALGGFDESFVPAWFEDVDVCKRLASLGSIVYWPASVFVHAGGVSAARLGYDRFLPLYYRNALRYWRKHHGAAAALLFRALLVAGMLLRLSVLPFRAAVPRSRREAARAYAGSMLMALGFAQSGGTR